MKLANSPVLSHHLLGKFVDEGYWVMSDRVFGVPVVGPMNTGPSVSFGRMLLTIRSIDCLADLRDNPDLINSSCMPISLEMGKRSRSVATDVGPVTPSFSPCTPRVPAHSPSPNGFPCTPRVRAHSPSPTYHTCNGGRRRHGTRGGISLSSTVPVAARGKQVGFFPH